MGQSSAKSRLKKLKKQNNNEFEELEKQLDKLIANTGIYDYFAGVFDAHRLHLITISKMFDEDEKFKEIRKTQEEVNHLVQEIDGRYSEVKNEMARLEEFDLDHIKNNDAKARLILQTIYRRMDLPGMSINGKKGKLLPYRSASELYDKDTLQEILSNFEKAHAFIPQWAYEEIMQRGWDGWGEDRNFVGTIEQGDINFDAAKNAESKNPGTGITVLENKCKVTAGSWSNYNDNPTNIIYRFIVNNPRDMEFGLQISVGDEGRAHKDYWLAGSKTGGGIWEAVINAIEYDDLVSSIKSGAVTIIKVIFNEGNTQEHILKSVRSDPTRLRMPSDATEKSEWAGSDIATDGGGE